MIQGISPFLKEPDETLIELGDDPEYFYFIAEGQCQVSLLDHTDQTEVKRALLDKGEYFGELAILYGCKRTATVKTANYCTFAQIQADVFLKETQTFVKKIKDSSKNYNDKLRRFKIKLLKQIEYFETFETDKNLMFFDEIQYHMKQKKYYQGDHLINIGQQCDSVVFVNQGLVEIAIEQENGDMFSLDMLQQGDLIGQYSCLDSKTFNFEAYVISKEATVFELERRFFDTFQHKIEGIFCPWKASNMQSSLPMS